MANEQGTATRQQSESKSLAGMLNQPVRVGDRQGESGSTEANAGSRAATDETNTMNESNTRDGEADGEAGEGAAAGMQTTLARFSDEFTRDVRPVLEPIEEAAGQLETSSPDKAVRPLLPRLRELTHQVQVLVDKVAEQQAYVLIFGPLKSGKSTFMNAMCGAYVSEVTCLPAYPCMVYVSHADEPEFIVTKYDGKKQTFTDRDALHRTVADAHEQLNARIREVEAGGESFDPAKHMPGAIRRIDVKVPAGDLAESGAVLVDTPGLYSRMKFGYDRMTREFRDAAACAIFIVKTDNLFLEQVFEEFHELLELFSRIFLLVNLDSTKQDLTPSGELTPSLEHEDPGQIIQAFETLAMSGPLKEAADEDRLKILPVDLLSAASHRIRGEDSDNGEAASATSSDESQGKTDGRANITRAHDDFDPVLSDLTDYLNSNEYLKAFLLDSLRRADTLMNDLHAFTDEEPVRKLGQTLTQLRDERDRIQAKIQAIERLEKMTWAQKAEGLRQAVKDAVQSRSEQVRQSTLDSINGAVQRWFENDASLQDMNQREINPLLRQTRSTLARQAWEELDRRTHARHGGLALDAQTSGDLDKAGIDLTGPARSAADPLKPDDQDQAVASRLTGEHIPVRRRMVDWLLIFRTQTTLRKRLFGPPDAPDHAIDAADKGKLLGEPAQEVMKQIESDQAHEQVEQCAGDLPGQFADSYLTHLSEQLQERLNTQKQDAQTRLDRLTGQLNETDRISRSLAAMRSRVETVSASVEELTTRYARSDPRTLTQARNPDNADVEQRHAAVEEGAAKTPDSAISHTSS